MGDWILRPPAPGDFGWIVERHAVLYAREFGFNEKFEALVAHVAGDFLSCHDAQRERCWIAERNGDRIGSVVLVRKTDGIGKLRLLLVEPSARGLGLGKALVADCIAFARQAGYRRVTLWTQDILLAARGIYRAAGFVRVSSEPYSECGPEMRSEEWELTL